MLVSIGMQDIVNGMDVSDMAECKRLMEERQRKLCEIKRRFPPMPGESKHKYVIRLRDTFYWKDLFVAYDLKV